MFVDDLLHIGLDLIDASVRAAGSIQCAVCFRCYACIHQLTDKGVCKILQLRLCLAEAAGVCDDVDDQRDQQNRTEYKAAVHSFEKSLHSPHPSSFS